MIIIKHLEVVKIKSVQGLHQVFEAKGQKSEGSQMDTRMLMMNGNRWYLNFTFPKKFKELEGKKIRISLGTADYKQAKNLRDRFVITLLAAKSNLQAINDLYESLVNKLSPEVVQARRD